MADTFDHTNEPAVSAVAAPQRECDGQEFKRLIQAGMIWLERHTQLVNSLNVFPVPDGDTGTNMYLTLQAAWQEIAGLPSESIGEIAHSVAHGALMGARGNSGVILSQLFRGISLALENQQTMNAELFARALQQASATAYKAVIRPVEGTILTVARQSAEAAMQAVGTMIDLRAMLELVVAEAERALANTPNLLPVLAEAGVVDSGGQGFLIILQGMLRHMYGDTLISAEALEEQVSLLHQEHSEEEYGYDVQFILQGADLEVNTIRSEIDAMGTCTLVVGDNHTIKVHVHVEDPGVPLSYGARHGSLSRVIVENMQEQYQDFMKGQTKTSPTPLPPKPAVLPVPKLPVAGIAVVAVVPGSGLAKVFESLGTSVIVPGGQTMNPSTEDLLKAIDSIDAPEVVILPNNKNVILTAQQAQKLTERHVRVVPSKSIPQGIGALLAFNYQADLDSNTEAMQEALKHIQTGEITRAVRSVKVDGVQVEEGQLIGLLNGRLVVAGSEMDAVILSLLEEMGAGEMEILTLYYGEETSAQAAQTLADAIAAHYPDQEVEVIEGNQPHYPYIISGE